MNSNSENIEIQRLKKQIRLLTLVTCILASSFLYSFIPKTDDIIKAKGIIITDEKGRDRILIGAPFPESKHRIRTDFEKSKAAWAEGFGGNFDWYKTNKKIIHEGAGMLVLDENGHDRVAVGSPVPTSFVGRIAPSHGITVNDARGFERGGWGLLKGEKIDRMVLGMDHISGYEGATMAVLEDGSTEIRFNDPANRNRLHIFNDIDKMKSGIEIFDTTGKALKTW